MDLFRSYGKGDLNTPNFSGAFEITPDDDVNIAVTRSVYVGHTGTLKVQMAHGDVVTFNHVVQGTVLPIRVKKVFADGTSAMNIIGLW